MSNEERKAQRDTFVQRAYDADRANPVLLSYWYPKIKDAGLKTPETIIIPVPIDVFGAFAADEVAVGGELIRDFVSREIVPKMQGKHEWFVKNGAFSDKFDFRGCITNENRVFDSFCSIQYGSAVLETCGISEFVLRRVIPWDSYKRAEIYHGMPLRTEVRVFYDFDTHKLLYSVNYWDYDYVRPHLRNRTDQIVFDALKDEMARDYAANRERVTQAVSEAMSRVADLAGKWSVDVLVVYEIIDFAFQAHILCGLNL